MAVSAATTQTYVVYGSRPVMYMNVSVVKYCVVSNVSACVTLTTYWTISPFFSLSAGGDQERYIPSGEDELPKTSCGNPLGATN